MIQRFISVGLGRYIILFFLFHTMEVNQRLFEDIAVSTNKALDYRVQMKI